ncbi:hypothetical protein M9Y10_022700 [Tritrichomonas musculus]|uniref:AAA+ ATPase domain-containing protein n=1 Tax=Tritrichomonas musculus TaxID=1915356 RepID=A0ABR2KT28_9EUKA
MASNSSSDYSDYDDSDNFEISDQDSFNIVPCSIPINFALFMNPAKMSEVKINESFLATVTSRKTTQLVKVIPSQECSPDNVLVPKLLQRTLDAAVGDKVAITGYDTKAKADAIQVVPLFDTEGINYKQDLIEYFKIESHPISISATFSLLINGAIRIFRIVNIIQIDRCCTTSATRIVLIDPKDLQAPHMAVLSRHFCDLALPSEIHNHINKYIFLPLQHQRLLRSLGVRSANGVIFYGVAGTGKTSALIAISREAHVQSLTITAPELLTMPVDQAFTKLQQGFQYVLNHTPAMLLIDDIGIIAGKTDSTTPFNVRRLRSYFVSLLDRSMQIPGFVIVATAQSKSEIDPSLIRFGRFGFEATLELPPSTQRAEILKLNMQGINIDQDDIIKLAGNTLEGKSCANVESVAEIGVCNMIRKSVAENRTYPLDDEIIKACTGHLTLEDFPVNVVDNGSVGAGSSNANAGSNEGLPSNQGGLSIMDMMSGGTGSGQADLGPTFGSGGNAPKIDDTDDFFDTLSIPKQAGTSTGMPDLDDSMFLGQAPPQEPQAPKSTGGLLPEPVNGNGSGSGNSGNGSTDMFGRPIQSNGDVDMFGRSKTTQPPVTDEMFTGFGGPEANNSSDNIVPDNQPPQQPTPPQQPPQPTQQPDSQRQQNDPFANFGSSEISSNPFSTGDIQSQPPQQSSQPQTPQIPQQSSGPTQQNDPFANFGSTEISSNPFATDESSNIQQAPQQNDIFGSFGGSGGFGNSSQQSSGFANQPPTNPFGQQQQQQQQMPPQAGSQPTSLPANDAFADFRNQGGNQQQLQNDSGMVQNMPPQAGSQPSNLFGGPQQDQNQNVADPFGSYGNSGQQNNQQPNPPQNPFGGPPNGPQDQQQNQPQNPFGSPQEQQPPQNPFGGPQDQPQNPFNSTPQPQNQPQNPFGGPPNGPQDQMPPQNPFGGPSNGPQEQQPQPQNPFGQPSGGSQDQMPPQNPFGGPQDQQQPQNPFGGPQQIADPFGSIGNNDAPIPQQPNSFGGGPLDQQQGTFGGPQQQPQQAGSFGGLQDQQQQQQQQSPFGGGPQDQQQSPFGGGPQDQQQQQDPFGNMPQQPQANSFGGGAPNSFGSPQNQQQQDPFGNMPQTSSFGGGPQQSPNSFGGPQNQQQDPFGGPPQQNSYGGGFNNNQQGGFGGFQQPAFQSSTIVLGGGSIYDMFNSSAPSMPQQEAPPVPQDLTPMYKPNVQDSGKQTEIIDIFGDNAKARKQQQQLQQQQQQQQQNMQAGSYGGPGMGGAPGMQAGPGMGGAPGMYNNNNNNGAGGFGNYGGGMNNSSGGFGQNYGGNYNNSNNAQMSGSNQFGSGGFGAASYGNNNYNNSSNYGNSGFGMGQNNNNGQFGGMGPGGNQFGGMGPGNNQFGGMGPGGNQFGGMNNNNNNIGMGAGGFGGGAPTTGNNNKDDPFSTYNPFGK